MKLSSGNKSAKRTTLDKTKKRRKLSTPIGGVIFLLAMVGLIAVVSAGVNTVKSVFDNSAQRERYESFISPVVMMDPVPFTRAENLEQSFLQQTAMWAVLTGDKRGSYPYDEIGLLLIPASDLDAAAKSLFGNSVVISHRSFDDNEASYLYDPEIKTYRVPLVAKLAYLPSVEKIDKKGDQLVLRVGYIAPGNIFSNDVNKGKGTDPLLEKYMLYELTKLGNGYYISAVRDVADESLPAAPKNN